MAVYFTCIASPVRSIAAAPSPNSRAKDTGYATARSVVQAAAATKRL